MTPEKDGYDLNKLLGHTHAPPPEKNELTNLLELVNRKSNSEHGQV